MFLRFPRRLVVGCGVVFFAGVVLCLQTALCEPLAPQPQYANIARAVAQGVPAMHLEGRPLDDEIAARALALFLTSLDGDHSFFLQSDVEHFRGQVGQLDDMLRKGNVSIAFEIADTYRKRAAERCEYVKKLLGGKLNLAKNERFIWRRRGLDTPWPANLREQNELWRKKVTDQYIRRVIAVELNDEKKLEAGKTGGTNQADKAAAKAADTNKQHAASLPEEMLSPEKFIIRQYEQFLMVIQDTDSEWVLEQYLTAFTHAFDPHSEYMSPSEVDNFDISMKLSLDGIGALLTSEDGAAKVVRIIPKGPADLDGRLQPGDKIVGVGEEGQEPVNVLHWPLNKIVARIRGAKGTRVVLSVIPAADISTTVAISIGRDEVKLEEQAAQGSVKELPAPDGTTNKLGIITLPGFYADMEGARRGAETICASADVRRILEDLKRQGVKGILVDLRNNGGGSLTEAVKITGLFITSGPVVQVKDQHDVVVLRDTDPSEVYDGPVVVLVNRMSASASEIFAGAMQDYGRAVVVGDSRTHGKGTVQSLVPVSQFDPRSGSLKVTSASFYRITGASTQEKGVDADIAVPSPLDVMEIGEEYLDFRLPWSKTDPAESRSLNTGNVIGDLLLWGLGGMTYSNQAIADIHPLVEQVKKMSEDRRSKDQRFALRNQLIKRFADKVKETEVSLNIKERRVEAKEEMRLLELQDEALAGETAPDGSSPAEAKRGGDIVVDEAEKILNDMTVLEKPVAAQ